MLRANQFCSITNNVCNGTVHWLAHCTNNKVSRRRLRREAMFDVTLTYKRRNVEQ